MAQAKIEKLITIAKIGDKGGKFWIKDTDGEFYSGFKEYQGVTNTEWSLLNSGNHGEKFEEGQQALIEFTKSAGTNKEGQDVIYKNLKAIYPADTTPKPHRVEKPHGEAPIGSQTPSRNYEQEGYERCCWTAFIEFMKLEVADEEFLKDMNGSRFWDVFQAIKKDSDKRFNPSKLRQAVEQHAPKVISEDLPTIQQDEDTGVEGIPF